MTFIAAQKDLEYIDEQDKDNSCYINYCKENS